MQDRIKPDEFQRVCRLAKLVEAANSKTFMFKTLDQKEGIELDKGRIITFQIKNPGTPSAEKITGQPIESKDILAVIGAFEEKPKEVKQDKEVFNKDGSGLIGIMPPELTKELIQKWKKLPVSERLIMLQNTDPNQIEERKGRAGQTYKYVPISYMIKAANMAFGFAWSIKVVSWIESATEIICNVELTAEVSGKLITKAATGQKDFAFKKDSKDFLCKGDDYKAAQADAIKKALSLFGIAQDVYSGDV